MKIDKQMQKDCIKKIKETAVKSGYRKIQDSIYKIENTNFIEVTFYIKNSEYLLFDIGVKKATFDNIFWQIMRMEENTKKSDSLKVIGAFSVSSVRVYSGEMELSEDLDAIARNVLEKADQEIHSFLDKNDIVEYILAGNVKYDEDILECLSYIDMGNLDKAKEFAKRKILAGKTGRFVNEGKGFFELLLEYNN